VQGSLPGVFPVFNFEGAFKEIVQQARSRRALKSRLRRREGRGREREEVARQGRRVADVDDAGVRAPADKRSRTGRQPPATSLRVAPARVPCTWEQTHQGADLPRMQRRRTRRRRFRHDAQPQATRDVDATLAARQVDETRARARVDRRLRQGRRRDGLDRRRTRDVLSWANAEFDRRHDDTVTCRRSVTSTCSAGLGGGARGFNRGRARVGHLRMHGSAVSAASTSTAAMRDFERLAGVRGTVLDLFSREQYAAFHGQQPPDGWREATPDDIRRPPAASVRTSRSGRPRVRASAGCSASRVRRRRNIRR
jgi:hypothetical protein